MSMVHYINGLNIMVSTYVLLELHYSVLYCTVLYCTVL